MIRETHDSDKVMKLDKTVVVVVIYYFKHGIMSFEM